MNILKILTLAAFFFMGIVSSFAQASLTLNQTFSALNAEHVQLKLSNQNIQIKPTKGSRIVVETSIQISVPNYNLLDFMQQSGRYQLEQQINHGNKTLSLSSKKIKHVLIIKGEEIHETINYTVYLPQTIECTTEQLEG